MLSFRRLSACRVQRTLFAYKFRYFSRDLQIIGQENERNFDDFGGAALAIDAVVRLGSTRYLNKSHPKVCYFGNKRLNLQL